MEEASERLIKGPEGGGLTESAFSEDGSGAGPGLSGPSGDDEGRMGR